MTETAFIDAKSYFAMHEVQYLGNGAKENDPVQPVLAFSFGRQPRATRNADMSEVKVGVIGAGDVAEKFILPTLRQRGAEIHIVDPQIPQYVKQNLNQETEHYIQTQIGDNSPAALPDDLSYILILTPPHLHLPVIKESLEKGVPIVVEKPIVGNSEDLFELERLVQEVNVPFYFIDWEIEHAKPLLVAALQNEAVNVPLADAVLINDPQGAFATFELRDVVEINGRFVEGGSNPLSDLKQTATGRSWLFDFQRGGGILYDMAVHPMNALAVLGFRPTDIKEVYLGKPTDTPGHYERFGKEPEGQNPTGEIYGRGEITMGIEGGRQDIKTTIEAAKGARDNDGVIELKDSKGRVLRWEMFPEGRAGSCVEMRAQQGIVAKAWMEADCYSLVFENVTRFVKEGEPVALYYQEQAATFRGIAAMHDHARSQEIPAGEIITQLKIQEGTT